MSFQTNIQAAFVAVGTDIKALLSKVGVLANLTTTAKGDLVGAINEVNAKAGATIDDTGTSATKVWSSSKTNTAINQVKTDILGDAAQAAQAAVEGALATVVSLVPDPDNPGLYLIASGLTADPDNDGLYLIGALA